MRQRVLEWHTTNNSAVTRERTQILKTQEHKKNSKFITKLTGYYLANDENQVLIEAKNYFKIAHLL